MTLRTPRRRISPQTKRRYRAIKGFFKRAVAGSLSQPNLQITSSIAVNVTDIKHKILGLEQQLNEVSKQCCSIPGTEISFTKESLSPTELRDESSQQNIQSETQLKGVETKILYKTSDNHYRKFDDSDLALNANNETGKAKSTDKMNNFYDDKIQTTKKKKSKVERRNNYDVIPDFRQHKTKSEFENFVSAYSTSSFHSIDQIKNVLRNKAGYSAYNEEMRDRIKGQNDRHKDKTYREHIQKSSPDNYDHHRVKDVETRPKTRIPKRNPKELDQNFIADIIRRQYKPIKMFGRKQSDLSQFSAPVCRDNDLRFIANSYIQDPRLSGCCCGERHYSKNVHHSDLRSICDTRLYSVKRRSRNKHRKRHADLYDDGDIYDLIPVKEKSSPKSRRKFIEDNMLHSAYYKEVPPSPKSHRPRLNLKVQHYSGSDYNMDFVTNPNKRISSRVPKQHQETEDTEETYYEMRKMKKHQLLHNPNKGHDDMADMQRDMGTMSSLQYASFEAEENTATVENPLNKTQDAMSSTDKTDKALCEIKDILQNFLQEIKKEASSHSGKSEIRSKITGNYINPSNDVKIGHSLNNFNSALCPTVPPHQCMHLSPFGNTCCYPMMPLCPMNCMHNNYAMTNTSFTCDDCNHKSNETNNKLSTAKSATGNDAYQCETDKLIQEIYKFVTQSPTFGRKADNLNKRRRSAKKASLNDEKVLTSRSAGESIGVRRHDANVGTPKINGVSKSCEAIGLKIVSGLSTNNTTASYSDTILEKMSQEATATLSTSDTDITEFSEEDKAKRNRFTRVLKSLGLCKKIKKDAIEELSESESTIDVQVKMKAPFQQEVSNYMMYGQEYNRPPPVSPHYRPEYPQDCRPPYNPDVPYVHEHGPPHTKSYHAHPEQRPTAPPYSNSFESYNQIQPQLPLCLKEIEVKSIGCQSERKISFFRKITQKIQQPVDTRRSTDVQRTCATQTVQNKPKLFNWKSPQPKMEDSRNNPYTFGYKTQKKLAEGDMKIRNAMMKKMFYKRNPFSPGNLILRTILGKDKSSYGEAPSMYRPRMFL